MAEARKNEEGFEEEEEIEDEGQMVEVIDLDELIESGGGEHLAADLVEMGIEDEAEENEEEDDDRPVPDNSIFTIDKHQGSVFSIDAYGDLLATGGEDDIACVWKIQENGVDLLFESDKFQDSVTNVKFSYNGKFLAAADMSGKIRVYSMESKAVDWSYDMESDLETLNWHPSCNVLFCGSAEGYFTMFKFTTDEVKMMYSGDNAAVSNFMILKDGKRAACSYGSGALRIWDLKSGQAVFNVANAHENDVLCMDLSGDGNLLATGGVDMRVRITNTLNGKSVCEFKLEERKESDEETSEGNSVESVAFCKTQPLFACATLMGQLYVWDLNTRTLRNQLENKAGFSKILWTEKEIFYVASLDGCVNSYDGRNLQLVQKFEGHKSEILDFCLSEKFLFTASNDKTVKMFKII